MMYQVTDPPTGILIVFGPNSSIAPSPLGRPDPASTCVPAGIVMPGTGGFPCLVGGIALAMDLTSAASCFCPRANCADGLMIVFLDGATVIFPDIPSRWRAHMKRYWPAAVDDEKVIDQFWPESGQPLL